MSNTTLKLDICFASATDFLVLQFSVIARFGRGSRFAFAVTDFILKALGSISGKVITQKC